MLMLKDLKDLQVKHYMIALASVGGLVCPGFLCLFLYHPELVASLDIFKVLLFSISLSLPTAFVIFFYTWSGQRMDYGAEKSMQTVDLCWVLAMVANLLIFSGVLFNSYLTSGTFSKAGGFLVQIVVYAAVYRAIQIVLQHRREKRKDAENAPKSPSSTTE